MPGMDRNPQTMRFRRLFTLSECYDGTARYYQAIETVRKRDPDVTEWLKYFRLGLHWQPAEVQEKGETAYPHGCSCEKT